MDKFSEYYNLLRIDHEETENLNRLITIEIETVAKTKKISRNKSPGPEIFIDEFYQAFKRRFKTYLPQANSKIE